MNQVSHNKPRLSFFVLLARSYHVIYKFGGEATLFHRDLLDFLVCLPFFFFTILPLLYARINIA